MSPARHCPSSPSLARVLILGILGGLLTWAVQGTGSAQETKQDLRRIHVYIALCDNDSQGIAPVPARIGNGDDLDNNLYWGCSDGLRSYFKKSKRWKLIKSEKQPNGAKHILERLTFRHASGKAELIADAVQGKEIERATTEFLNECAGKGENSADLVAYIGHNGLMDFDVPLPKPAGEMPKLQRDAIVLACVSDIYFSKRLRSAGTRPVLMTKQLMYPGSFLLHDAIEGWLKKESSTAIRGRAAAAYAKNQKISVRAARGIFADLSQSGAKTKK